MKMLCTLFAAMMLLTTMPITATAEELTGLTASEIVAQMGIGWNLGNTFDATGGSKSLVYSQEQSWGNPKVESALIKRVKEAGFTTIRIPVTWYRQLSYDGKFIINPAFLARVKEVVDMAYAEGLFVIINMHHEQWLNSKNLDKDYEKIGVQLAAIWRQIADTFAEYDQHLIFEGMNEPRLAGTPAEWNGTKEGSAAVNYLNQVFVDTIRTDAQGYNGERALMIPAYAASNSAILMNRVVIPQWNGEQAKNIIASVHSYSPYDFCLSDKLSTFDPKQHASSINEVFINVKYFFLDKGIPVVIGETGATNTNDNTEERGNWAYYMAQKAATYGVPIIIWDNGASGKSGGECHVWINRRGDEITPYPELLERLFEGAASVEWGSGVK